MTKMNLNTIAKRFFLGNILAAAIFFSMQASAANLVKYADGESTIDSIKNKLEVKYLGNNNSNLEFDVRYNNLKGTKFYFLVKDEDGDVLFEKEYNSKQFHKKVQLAKVDDIKKLSFSIVMDNESVVQTKEVAIKTQFFEDVLVKLN